MYLINLFEFQQSVWTDLNLYMEVHADLAQENFSETNVDAVFEF